MDLKTILKVTNGTTTINKNIKFKNIKIDSRNLKKDDLFIAIKGSKLDGHDFANDKNVSIVSKKIDNKNIIQVKDTYQALYDISKFQKNIVGPKVIAITGSVGKTMTKELIYEILKTKYKVLKTEKNQNNHIGVPLTLLKLKNEDYLVVELGMNHKKEISNLSKLVNPDIAVITNIGSSHIGNLKSKRNIFKAKMEILDGMKYGILLTNGDDKYLKKTIGFKCGLDNKNDLYAFNIYSDLKMTLFNVKIENKIYTIRINVPGKYLITNVLLAIKVGLLNNIDMESIIDAIDKFKYIENRLEITFKEYTMINDCYNSSYESLMGVLDLIKKEENRKIIILGDILELGKKTNYYSRKIQKELKKIPNSKVLLVGDNFKKIKGFYHFKDNTEIINYLKTINLDKSIILIKGSRMMHLEEVVKYLKEVQR